MGDIADWHAEMFCEFDDPWAPNEPFELSYVRVERETEKAWLILLEETPPTHRLARWFPKSQCDIHEDSKIIIAPYWLVKEKRLG